MSTQQQRHILHVDMDAFFASVEQRDRPELRGKPVLVGGDPHARGVVSAASYEARRFGCRSAMPMAKAVRLCPHAVVLPVRGGAYAQASREIFTIFENTSPLVEPLSIDEAFLDVTPCEKLLGHPETIARKLKKQIRDKIQLTASIGVAPNKFLAKLASDLDKPDGLVIVPDDHIQNFLDPLPISRLWGVGKVTLTRLKQLGLHTFADVRSLSRTVLKDNFGSAGEGFFELVRGIDNRPVVSERDAKSISSETTFAQDVTDRDYLRTVLLGQTDHVAGRLRTLKLLARTVTLKVRLRDFKTITRNATLDIPTDQTESLWQTAAGLFETWSAQNRAAVRLIGMGVSSFTAGQQLLLFDRQDTTKHREIDHAVDQIRNKFGANAITRGITPRPDKKP